MERPVIFCTLPIEIMNSEDASNLRKTFFDRENLLFIYLPGLISILLIYLIGQTAGFVFIAAYTFIVSIFLKGSKKNLVFLSLFLLFELAITILAPEKWEIQTTNYFRLIATNVLFTTILLWLVLINKPFPQLFVEKINPELKSMKYSKTKVYVNIFKKLSLFWIAGYLLQIFILLSFYPIDEETLTTLMTIFHLPFYVTWSFFGFLYVNRQIKKLDRTG